MRADEAQIIRFVVLFTAGAIVGAVIGFRVVLTQDEPLWFFGGIAAGALAGGLLSWRLGGRFWESFRYMWWGL
jgi:hypothetical protein